MARLNLSKGRVRIFEPQQQAHSKWFAAGIYV